MTGPIPLDLAVDYAVSLGWSRSAAESVSLTLIRFCVEQPLDPGTLLRELAEQFPGPRPWHEQARELIEECGRVVRRLRERVRSEAALQALVALAGRKLGIALLPGIARLLPMRDLVAVLDLPEETLRAISPSGLTVAGQVRSPGWFVARVVALPEAQIPGLAVGDKVLVEDRCSPDGAGWIPSEEFGLPAGGRVVLVPCRRLPTAQRSEELTARLREVQEFGRKYPADKFPKPDPAKGQKGHPLWATPEGEALLAQMGEHAYQMQEIMRQRRGCARNRMIKAGKDDVTLPDGIVGVIEVSNAEPR